jgi:hypothetical protein
LFRRVQTLTLFVGCPVGAPDMFQVGPDLQEKTLPPLFAAKAFFAIVIPVLGSSTKRQGRHDYAFCKDSRHDLSSPIDYYRGEKRCHMFSVCDVTGGPDRELARLALSEQLASSA